MVEQHSNVDRASTAANGLRETAIEHGHNFASINLTKDVTCIVNSSSDDWGTNHLKLDITTLDIGKAADKIFKWLCKHDGAKPPPLAAY